MTNDTGVLDEAYERFHKTGPEFDGFLSNHGPMAVEAMVRHGHADAVHRWVDSYSRRLEDQPRGLTPVTDADWREALGEIDRVADWTVYFTRAVAEDAWRNVLEVWWPRLLPGIAAGATHGVIRVGHAVRTLLGDATHTDADDPRVVEFAHAMAYWASRWQPVFGDASTRTGRLCPAEALDGVPLVADQSEGIRHRFGQLETTGGWTAALSGLAVPTSPDDVPDAVAEIADAATLRYFTHGHGSPVMLVHSATAPTAVLRTLPALPQSLWMPSLDAAWAATAAVTAAYATPAAAVEDELAVFAAEAHDLDEVLARAVAHGDEHVIKLADTAADVYARTADRRTLAAAVRSAAMIEAPTGS